MKIAIISDTHGNVENIIMALKDIKDIDLLIHLGDHASDGEKIAEELNIKAEIVRGNCDNQNKGYETEKILEINGLKVFITHGHNYNVNLGLDKIYYSGLEKDAKIILFGHTHIPIKVKIDDVFIVNPGSPEKPRSPDGIKTFAIMEIDKNIQINIKEIFF